MEEVDHVVVVVCNEHDHIKGLFRKYVSPSSSPALKLKYIRELTKELLYHSMAEEEVLYPVVYEVLGEAAQQHAEEEHQSLKLILGDLDAMALDHPEFDAKVHQLMEVFFDHIHEEEHLILVPLREELEDEQLQQLGRAFLEAKQQMAARNGAPGACAAPEGAEEEEEAEEALEEDVEEDEEAAGAPAQPWAPDQAPPHVAVA